MNKLIKLREKYFILFDFIISLFVLDMLIFINKAIKTENMLVNFTCQNTGMDNFILTMAQIYGTLLGFVIAVAAMIFAFDHSKRIEFVKKGKHYPSVLKIYTSASKFLMIALISHIFLFFIKYDDPNLSIFIFYFMVWLLLVNLIKIYRCIWILKNLFNLSLE